MPWVHSIWFVGEKKICIITASYSIYCRLFLLHITCINPVFPVSWRIPLHICEYKKRIQYLLCECVYVSCAFALCPGCYVFWYVAKGRGQAESRTAGAQSGGAAAGKIRRAKGQPLWREQGLGQSHEYQTIHILVHRLKDYWLYTAWGNYQFVSDI